MEYQETLRVAQEQGHLTPEQREGLLAAARELRKTDDLETFLETIEALDLTVNPEKTAKNLLEGE